VAPGHGFFCDVHCREAGGDIERTRNKYSGTIVVQRISQNDEKLREALRDLLSDIESMYEGAETPAEGGQPEEFFGPFSVWKLDHSRWEPLISVSWPNLAISLRNAKDALRNAGTENPPTLPPTPFMG
jgi:hypothetical protein